MDEIIGELQKMSIPQLIMSIIIVGLLVCVFYVYAKLVIVKIIQKSRNKRGKI